MGLGDHVNIQPKRGVKIITCDPQKRLIEAETRNGEVITVNAYNYTPSFRWPKPGEKWMVGEENGSWYLEGIYEAQGTEGSTTQAEPGDVVLSASSGRILVNEEGKLSQLKSEEEELSLTGYQEIAAAKGVGLGEFEIAAQAKARFILAIFTINDLEPFGQAKIVIAGNPIAITERSGSVGAAYKTTLTVVLPPNVPAKIEGSGSSKVTLSNLWESI